MENWISSLNNASASTVWYVTTQIDGVPRPVNTTVLGGSTLDQITFASYSGMTTTWVMPAGENGWFGNEIRPTPEPSTYGAIFLSGCFGLIGWRRWRAKRAC